MRTFDELNSLMLRTLSKYESKLDGRASDWTLKISPNIKACGVCYFAPTRVIVLNKWMVENSPIEQVIDTLLHEIAHAFAGIEISPRGRQMGHGKVWKAWARKLGATPKATVPLSELGEGAVEFIGKKKTAKGPKYYILYHTPNGDFEKVTSCKRRLKQLHGRGISGRPETYGRLWHVLVEDYEKYADRSNILKTKIFK